MTQRTTEGLEKVAVFIDRENLTGLDEESLMAMASEWGRIAFARGYSKRRHRHHSRNGSGLSLAGISAVKCPMASGRREDGTDLVMMKHIIHTLAHRPDIQCYVVCTGDGGFVPVVTIIRALGRRVIVVGPDSATSYKLVEAADHYLVAPRSGNGSSRHEDAYSHTPAERPSGYGKELGLRSRATCLPPLQKPRPGSRAEQGWAA